MKNILVKDFIGETIQVEDAVLIKSVIKDNLDENIILDFEGTREVPISFFASLLYDMMYTKGRDYVMEHLGVKNLSNMCDFNRVIKGTAFN